MSKYFTVDGINYDRETALPHPDANAMMLNYVDGQWELSGWGGYLTDECESVNDWELLARANTFAEIIEIAKIYAEGIEEG